MLERRIMEDTMSVSFERIYLNHSWSWQVSLKAHSMYDEDGRTREVFHGGGGHTLRDAIESLVSKYVSERLDC